MSYYKEIGFKRAFFGVIFFIAAVALAVVSSYQTILFFKSSGRDSLGVFLAAAGIAMDFGQYGFPVAAAISAVLGKSKKTIYTWWFLTALCFAMSFATSMGSNANEMNATINDMSNQAKKVETYQKESKQFDLTSANAESLQKEIVAKMTSRDADKNKIERSYASQIAKAKKRSYYAENNNGVMDSVSEYEKQIKKEQKEVDNYITTLQAAFDEKNKALEKSSLAMKAVEAKIKPTEGVLGLAYMFGKTDPTEMAKWLFIIKEILIQLFAIGFSRGMDLCLTANRVVTAHTSPPNGNGKKKKGFFESIFGGGSAGTLEGSASGTTNRTEEKTNTSPSPLPKKTVPKKYTVVRKKKKTVPDNVIELKDRTSPPPVPTAQLEEYKQYVLANIKKDGTIPGDKVVGAALKAAAIEAGKKTSTWGETKARKCRSYFESSGLLAPHPTQRGTIVKAQ